MFSKLTYLSGQENEERREGTEGGRKGRRKRQSSKRKDGEREKGTVSLVKPMFPKLDCRTLYAKRIYGH